MNTLTPQEEINRIVKSFEEQWRNAHKIEGNNGEHVIYSLNFGCDVLLPWLRTALQEYRKVVLEEVERGE